MGGVKKKKKGESYPCNYSRSQGGDKEGKRKRRGAPVVSSGRFSSSSKEKKRKKGRGRGKRRNNTTLTMPFVFYHIKERGGRGGGNKERGKSTVFLLAPQNLPTRKRGDKEGGGKGRKGGEGGVGHSVVWDNSVLFFTWGGKGRGGENEKT